MGENEPEHRWVDVYVRSLRVTRLCCSSTGERCSHLPLARAHRPSLSSVGRAQLDARLDVCVCVCVWMDGALGTFLGVMQGVS